MTRSLLGVTGPEFEAAYERGSFRQSGSAQDLASVLPLIRRLRAKEECKGIEAPHSGMVISTSGAGDPAPRTAAPPIREKKAPAA